MATIPLYPFSPTLMFFKIYYSLAYMVNISFFDVKAHLNYTSLSIMVYYFDVDVHYCSVNAHYFGGCPLIHKYWSKIFFSFIIKY